MTTLLQSPATQLLLDWSDGNMAALDQLVVLVYQELRTLARCYMRGVRVGHPASFAAPQRGVHHAEAYSTERE
jgi:hypothetical protein